MAQHNDSTTDAFDWACEGLTDGDEHKMPPPAQ